MKSYLASIITLASILTGCGEEFTPQGPRPDGVDQYLQSFKEDAVHYGFNFNPDDFTFNLNSNLGIVDGITVNGKCTHPNHIEISTAFWERHDRVLQEMVIYHELGHCFLNREHTSNFRSLMVKDIELVESLYKVNRAAYIEELFTGGNE
jgi:hypothetical protein